MTPSPVPAERARPERDRTPTLDEIGQWPATVTVPRAASVLGISYSHAYELLKSEEFPFRTLKLRGRYAVVTSSILDVLSGGKTGPDQRAGREDPGEQATPREPPETAKRAPATEARRARQRNGPPPQRPAGTTNQSPARS